MRIEKFLIKNYKSILNSGEVTLDPEITTLIGKNESGKTYTLKALESFNSKYKYNKKDLCLHSEVREKLIAGSIEEGDIELITIWLKIEDKDIQKLKEIHPQLTKIKTLKCTKYFDGLYYIESPEISLGKIDSKKELDKSLSEIRRVTKTFKKKLDEHTIRYASFNGSKAQYEELINELVSFDPETNPNIVDFFNNYYKKLRNLPNVDEQIQNDVKSYIKEIESHKSKIKESTITEEEVTTKILKVLPNFIYFADIEKLNDTVAVSDFLAKKKTYKTLSNLIELSGLDIENVKDAEEYDMISELRSASTTISGLVNQSWTQEKINVNIGIVRDNIVLSIFDDVIKKEHPPSIRSQGFQWFLSFYINFTAGSKGEFENTIILLDDPGVYLHPSGQKDLLKTLERISKSNQVVFSSHSPFMIDRQKFKRIRIVSKKAGKGTLIEEKFYKSDYDALQPIRAAIGMTIGDSLFTTKRNLLVEGYSDELILEAMSKLCFDKEKEYIDTSKISILPTGGAEKMPYFSILLTKENLKFLVLLDHDPEGRKIAKELKDKFNLDEGKVITLNTIANRGNDLEIENLIDFDFYLKALNLAYEDVFQKKLGKTSITKNDVKDASFKGIKDFFRNKKIGTSKRIDKIEVAKKIYDLVAQNITPQNQTISNFSKLFKTINEYL